MARACARAFAAAITLMAVEGAIAQTGSVLSLRRSSRTLPATGDPVWQLQLTLPGQKTHNFEAVVGRASRQQADRHRLGSQAPLPAGRYRLTEVSEIRPEVPWNWGGCSGSGWSPESGTDGCIGLIRSRDLLTLAALLEQSGTRDLVVIQ
ncbi:MAG: L,D-transpeptidase [Cyanobium sp. CZS 48M]|nr:L,D-transpeptidase [Cyanobium sp. CZS48M]